MRQTSAALGLFGIAFLMFACGEETPVAPSEATLSVTASPQEIPVNGSSTIRVIATQSSGKAVNPGTLINLTSSLGELPPVVETTEGGQATATLQAGSRSGTATITASSGAAAAATVDVQIGFQAGNISLITTPQSVSEQGGTVGLLAIVRDTQGEPLQNAGVNFITELGQLDSGGRLVETNDVGEATDILRFSEEDGELDPFQESFDVFAEVGGGGGSATADATIQIRRLPRADFTFRVVQLTVEFTDTTTGAPIQWQWDFGDNSFDSSQDPVHTYPGPGTYTVTLAATNAEGTDTRQKLITVN